MHQSPQPIANRSPQEMRGLIAAFSAPIALGFAPVLGKLAYLGGSDPFTVAATRTVISAVILWIAYLIFFRKYIYIYPAGLLGCVVIGVVNGIGSLFYYNGLRYLDASVSQLLNATYLLFVVVLSRLAGQHISNRTRLRGLLALVAVGLLTGFGHGNVNWLGIGLMIGNAILFAGTFMLSQRVLYEMPSPTVALYVMTTMAIVVVMARVVYRVEWVPQSQEAALAIIGLGFTTAIARLLMFAGIKRLGGLQTVFLGILETGVALILAALFLHEQLTTIQWMGVGVLLVSLLLISPEEFNQQLPNHGPIFNMAGIAFQKVAFTQAFLPPDMPKLTAIELEQIRRMLESSPDFGSPNQQRST